MSIIDNYVSGSAAVLVGDMDDSSTSGKVQFSPVEAFEVQVDNTPGNDTLLTSILCVIDADKPTAYGDKAERVWFTGGTETTDVNGNAVVEYDLTYRGVKNKGIGQAVDAAASLARNFRSHESGAQVVLDEAWLVEVLGDEFKSNVANRFAQFFCFDGGTNVSVGDGRAYFQVPSKYNGDSISIANATVITAGATGDTTVQIYNITEATDTLSTPITIASGATTGAGVVDVAAATVSTGDLLRVDIDTVSTTAPVGLLVNIEFQA